jgi:hypothetical protein
MATSVSMKFNQGGKFAFCTFDYLTGTGGSATLEGKCLDIRDAWVASMVASQSADVALVGVSARQPSGVTAEIATLNNGLSTLPALPINCAVLAVKRTASATKGRMFIPGILESQVNSAGVIDAGAHAAWATSCTNFLTELAARGVDMAVVGKGVGGIMVDHLCTSFVPQTTISTQRRRMRK